MGSKCPVSELKRALGDWLDCLSLHDCLLKSSTATSLGERVLIIMGRLFGGGGRPGYCWKGGATGRGVGNCPDGTEAQGVFEGGILGINSCFLGACGSRDLDGSEGLAEAMLGLECEACEALCSFKAAVPICFSKADIVVGFGVSASSVTFVPSFHSIVSGGTQLSSSSSISAHLASLLSSVCRRSAIWIPTLLSSSSVYSFAGTGAGG